MTHANHQGEPGGTGGEDLAKVLRDAYGRGFSQSGEGYNGEYPGDAHEKQSRRNERDAWIRQYMAQLPATNPIATASNPRFGEQEAWSDLSPQEIVRRTRCRAESFGTQNAEIWRLCCDEILSKLGPEGPPVMSEWEALEVIGQLPAALTADEHASAFRSAATRCASPAPARSRRLDARADKIELALRTLQAAGEVR